MSEQFYTYLYRDPKDGTPIYVGKGTGGRAWKHLNRKTNRRANNLIKKRIAEGYTVEPILNHETDETTAHQMEAFWIDFYGRADLGKGTLFNLSDGGEGNSGHRHSAETRARMSASHIGKTPYKRTDEIRKKISDAKKGNVPHNKGKSFEELYSGEQLELMRESVKGFAGRKHSEEAKAKMSATHKERGTRPPPRMPGTKMSDETKSKMAASAKLARARRKLKIQDDK